MEPSEITTTTTTTVTPPPVPVPDPGDLADAVRAFDWTTWGLDWATWGWIGWMVFFMVWETVTLMAGTNQELTEHLRPLFLFAPVLWFAAVGVWLWLGIHLLWPAAEAALQQATGRI